MVYYFYQPAPGMLGWKICIFLFFQSQGKGHSIFQGLELKEKKAEVIRRDPWCNRKLT
jgi:hypothetical protein